MSAVILCFGLFFVYASHRQETLSVIITENWFAINYSNFLSLGIEIFLSQQHAETAINRDSALLVDIWGDLRAKYLGLFKNFLILYRAIIPPYISQGVP